MKAEHLGQLAAWVGYAATFALLVVVWCIIRVSSRHSRAEDAALAEWQAMNGGRG